MTGPAPDVSIIIAAWRASATLDRAIASALASEGVTVEVIAVDDASPDDTWPTLQRLAAADPRIVIDRLPVNSGPSAARNRAISLARGRFIAILDADDEITPSRLARLIALVDLQSADIAVDNMIETGAGRPDAPFLKSPAFAVPREIDLETWIAFNQPLGRGDCLGYLKPVIRRDTLAVTYDEALRNSEDYYLIANLLADGARMAYTPEPGYRYTRSPSSTSHRLKPDQTRGWLGAESRFLARHGARLSPAGRGAQARRLAALRNVDRMVATVDALKSRRLAGAAGLIVSDPRAGAFTLATLARIALGKLLGRRLV